MSLQTAKKRFLKRKLINYEDFHKLSKSDPSKSYKYLEKMCEFYVYDKVEIDILCKEVDNFHFIPSSYLENSDIQSIPNHIEFEKIVKDALNKKHEKENKKFSKDNSIVLVDDEEYQIVIPNSIDSSIKYGQGTKWCTAAKEDNYFNSYREDNTLYYIWNKKLSKNSYVYKIAVVVNKDNIINSVWNAKDHQINEHIVEPIISKYKEKFTFKYVERTYTNEYEKYGLDTTKITFNSDGTINYDGNVDLIGKKLTKIPFNFKYVNGYFNISNNLISSLKGCPERIESFFSANYNKIKSLKYGPMFVGTAYSVTNNQLRTIKGIAKEIGFTVDLDSNKISNVKGFDTIKFKNKTNLYLNGNKLKNSQLKYLKIYEWNNVSLASNKLSGTIDSKCLDFPVFEKVDMDRLILHDNEISIFKVYFNFIDQLSIGNNKLTYCTLPGNARNVDLSFNLIERVENKSISDRNINYLILDNNKINQINFRNIFISGELSLKNNNIEKNSFIPIENDHYINTLHLGGNPINIEYDFKFPKNFNVTKINNQYTINLYEYNDIFLSNRYKLINKINKKEKLDYDEYYKLWNSKEQLVINFDSIKVEELIDPSIASVPGDFKQMIERVSENSLKEYILDSNDIVPSQTLNNEPPEFKIKEKDQLGLFDSMYQNIDVNGKTIFESKHSDFHINDLEEKFKDESSAVKNMLNEWTQFIERQQ